MSAGAWRVCGQTADEPDIALSVVGTGECLVFLHGLGSTRESWSDQIEFFSNRYCAIAWDARGYGDSGDVAGERNFAVDFASDLARILDRLGVQRAHLVGLSMGGIIAQCFYHQHPDRVATLTLADTFESFPTLGEAAVAGFLKARLQPLIEGATPADLAPGAVNALLAPGANPHARARLLHTLSTLRSDPYQRTLLAMAHQHALGPLSAIGVPTLVLTGELDRLAPVAIAQAIAAGIAGSQLSILPGIGHLTNLEDPAAFNATLAQFLNRHAGLADTLSVNALASRLSVRPL